MLDDSDTKYFTVVNFYYNENIDSFMYSMICSKKVILL